MQKGRVEKEIDLGGEPVTEKGRAVKVANRILGAPQAGAGSPEQVRQKILEREARRWREEHEWHESTMVSGMYLDRCLAEFAMHVFDRCGESADLSKLIAATTKPFVNFCEKHGPDSIFFEVEECNECKCQNSP
jgi:hypothetical protein